MSNTTPTNGEVKKPIFGDSSYDVAKNATTIWLPALATLYAAVAAILGLPYAVEVVGVISAVVVFLGTVLKISADRYAAQPVKFDGQLVVNHTDPLADNYKLELEDGWESLAKNEEIRINVVDVSQPVDPYHDSGK